MKKSSREVNVFSMSALDLFASALGAFILISVVLMPYYLKAGNVEECPVPEPVPDCPICPRPSPVPSCPVPDPVKIADNLLVVQMEWDDEADVDLHVYTPDGLFKYNRTILPGKPGKFTLDNTDGGEASL